MFIKEIIKIHDKNVAYCIGGEITSGFTCSKINIDGDVYDIRKVGVANSFTNTMFALLELPEGIDGVEIVNKEAVVLQ